MLDLIFQVVAWALVAWLLVLVIRDTTQIRWLRSVVGDLQFENRQLTDRCATLSDQLRGAREEAERPYGIGYWLRDPTEVEPFHSFDTERLAAALSLRKLPDGYVWAVKDGRAVQRFRHEYPIEELVAFVAGQMLSSSVREKVRGAREFEADSGAV